MMGTEIFKIDASWAEKLTKTRVQFLLTPTVVIMNRKTKAAFPILILALLEVRGAKTEAALFIMFC